MSPHDIVRVRVQAGTGSPVAWADGKALAFPRPLADDFHRLGLMNGRNELSAHRVVPEARPYVEELLQMACFTEARPASSRIPFSYHRIPPRVRVLMAHAIGRVNRRRMDRWAAFPSFPLDLSTDFLSDLAGGNPSPFAQGPTPVLLTHDCDSAEGLENLVKWFLDMDESVGARTTNFIVPCGWPISEDWVRAILDRGHQLGVHGYDHSNKTPYLEERERQERLEAGLRKFPSGLSLPYRAPSLCRTRGLLRSLSKLFRTDSSIPTSGGLFPIPNNGCASARPFWVEGIREIPLTMPRDGSLRFLGYSPDQILKIWIDCAEAIADSGGVVLMLTHCEERFSGTPAMRCIYKELLRRLAASERFVFSTLDEVLQKAFTEDRSPYSIGGGQPQSE